MKKIYTAFGCFLKFKLVGLILFSAIATSCFSQNYYSNFTTNVSSHVSVTNPSGLLCLAPSLQNTSNVADASLTNYTSYTSLLSVTLACNTTLYKIRADLNLMGNGTSLPAGYYAGFRVRFSSLLNLSLLNSSITLSTYLNNTLQETATGSAIINLGLLATTGGVTDLYFVATKPFNQVEIDQDESLIPLAVAFESDYYYAFASGIVLPVNLMNFNVQTSNASNIVSWQTGDQANIQEYQIERSSDGVNYSVIANELPVDKNSYSFEDRSLLNGTYYYRIKTISNNGEFQYSASKETTITAGNKITVYPTLLSHGEAINIKTATSENVTAQLFSFDGQLIEQATGSGNFTLPTGNLTAGVYVVKVTDQMHHSTVYKVSCF